MISKEMTSEPLLQSQLERYKQELMLDFPNLEPCLIDFMLFLYKQKHHHKVSKKTHEIAFCKAGDSVGAFDGQ